ncbi:MAG: hypothetical protein HOP16_01190 [Acidobacteria bacterium]|nr:hypothetical protein [Acidobacteriota bacterium]
MSLLTSRALVVLCSSVLLAGCGGEDPVVPTTPTPALPTATETFSGAINRNGAVTHTFIAGAAGEVIAKLVAVAPETVESIGLSLGTWNITNSTCQTIISNDSAVQGAEVKGAASIASNLCVRIYDVGKIPAQASYEVTVSHF